MPRIQFRLSDELNTFVESRAKESKISPSEYLRLLIVRDIDDTTRAKNLALEEVNKQLEELQKDVVKLQDIKKLLAY
jgi:hypoxanthine phosphoribosyltransferase